MPFVSRPEVDEPADEFEAERPHLTALARRMLGSFAEAEDAVQEAWLRYSRVRPGGEIADPRGWLTTVTGRICLDVLKSARVAREAYPGQWLPDAYVDPDSDPAADAVRSDQVGTALLVVMEKLTPEQRVALVLHDAFGVPFDEVAAVLGSSEAAARQHASRGRRAVAEGRVRQNADAAEQRKVIAAFVAAAREGDLEALIAVLAPDVVAMGDAAGRLGTAARPIVGADHVARFYLGILGRRLGEVEVERVLVNGEPGLLVDALMKDGRPLVSALAFTVADGLITGLFNQMNPAKQAGPAAGTSGSR